VLTSKTYIIVLIVLIHAPVTFIFRNDFSSVLNDDLISIEASIASHSIATINRLDNLNTNSILAAPFTTLLKISKGTVGAILTACSTVGIVTLVEHDSVLAIFITSTFGSAHALRRKAVK
jgi:hypothetical protein